MTTKNHCCLLSSSAIACIRFPLFHAQSRFFNIIYEDENRDNASYDTIYEWYDNYPHEKIPLFIDENKLLSNYDNLSFYDHQGTHFAPHLTTKEIWDKVGGFSEEFNPGDGSDSDFNMKLWQRGVRLFKGLNDFKVYHFGSISMRKKADIIKNDGTKTFLKKWGITPKFFFKYYLRTGKKFDGLLNDPNKSPFFYLELLVCKIKYYYLGLLRNVFVSSDKFEQNGNSNNTYILVAQKSTKRRLTFYKKPLV